MSITTHAGKRLQQRSIAISVVDLLECFGTARRCGGAEKLFIDHAARRRIEAHFGRAGSAVIERCQGRYAVIGDDGFLVTAGHITKRIKNHTSRHRSTHHYG
jgi:hypothetical protein